MANSVSEERINSKAKEILANLGYVYRTDGDNDPGIIQECTYSAYGLKLAAYDLPGYVYELKDKPGLSSIILNHMKKILAFDCGGTNTRLALINEHLEIEKESRTPTPINNKEKWMSNIKHYIKRNKPNIA